MYNVYHTAANKYINLTGVIRNKSSDIEQGDVEQGSFCKSEDVNSIYWTCIIYYKNCSEMLNLLFYFKVNNTQRKK